MSNNIYDIMKKLNAVSEQDVAPVSKQGATLLESTMKEVLNEKYMGFDKTVAAIKKGGSAKDPEAVAASIGRKKYGKEKFQTAAAKGKKLSERVSVGAEYELDPADIPMPGNKLSPKDQYQAISKDVEHVDQRRRGLKPGYNLEKDSDVGRFAAPGYGDQGQFFQEDDMEEGNKFTGNLAKARAAGKKRADLDGGGDMETVREGAKPDYIDLDKDGNRKESMKKAAADKKKRGVAEGSKAPAFNWTSWDPDNYESGSPEYYSSLSNAILSLVKEKFGGKAWFDGGGYAYLIDVSNPKKLVSSDGADINVPNVARGLEKYTSNFKENFVDVYPSDWPDFFRSPRKRSGPESDQEWYELGKMGIDVRENSHKLSGQGVAEDSWGTMKITPSTAKPLSVERPKGEWDPIHGKAPKKNTLKYDIWREKVRQDKGLNCRGSHNKQVKEQGVAESIQIGSKVRITNPKASKHHEVVAVDDTHYTIKKINGETIKLPKERIDRLNKQGVAKDVNNSIWVVSYSQERKSYGSSPDQVSDEEQFISAPTEEEAIARVKSQARLGTNMYPGSFKARLATKAELDDLRNDDIAEQGVAEGTKETSTGRIHKAEPGGYGRKDDEDEDKDKKKDKKAEPAVKRGRGRPKKDADSETGEVKKWDTDTLQSWIGSVPKKLPGKASVKHKIKDEPDEKLDEVAPPGAKAERMVKHIKKGYAKDGKVTPKEKGIAYATAWKAKKAGKVEESIPPGFPRELAKRIYEHYAGDMNSTLTAMWNVHNTVMESKVSRSKKKLSEGMTFEQSTTKPAMGTYKGGVWTADPPKKGEVGVPAPSPDEGAPASSPAKKRPAPKAAKEDVSENKELSDVLKLAGMVEESVKVDECGMSPIGGAYGDSMTNTEGRMSISTNMSTDGNKTVTITADGDAAGDLMKMLKLAGINSDGGEDTDVEKMSEEKDDRYEANTTPEEEVLPVQTQLKGGNGEVAGKEKKMTPHGYKFADNPLAMKESMTLKLMKEYESIKKTK